MVIGTESTSLKHLMARYTHLSWRAMLTEVNLTPKPGLVDRRNNGAHKDMTLVDFHHSALAIACYAPHFIESGVLSAKLDASSALPLIRRVGLACEEQMYRATSGVNTHKGTIFSLGLLLAAIGRHYQRRQAMTARSLSQTVALFCQGIVVRELGSLTADSALTAGQKLYLAQGLSGARGEAEAGFPQVIDRALPYYLQWRYQRKKEYALMNTLLLLMAHNNDTNVASRGGIAGLHWIQRNARQILARGGVRCAADIPLLYQFDDACIVRNLSPGGSADLLILTWFLSHFTQE
ncbi:triphosphoribosyl-dephospho-CoA synthase CitG [Salmonella enterica subsp. salamae serovar 6,7:z:1,5]|nr:triphosphoribosyl-dephospho-CoA synthase CitG [Salmonella enterica subsp. salamae serovar 6,7:z:1,5]HCH7729728.1 triphosphoribosyl-dephospho-CoA synthase CitG [Salmonella enterica subsp. enterica serovar Infantis]HCH7829761.1 triphosphoribosyl-dephospho-CoA synthase CitG [Salmonella enterica subsp. enterica serovar Infantis]HCH7833138.1 triphosphoribosyl-dephospho-CoA synthase CitG [Salmonella enterica subsp. enterica serovar Infantis]HCI4928248.1 triphosphoribosyl-dephospho-CoA synthase Cit